MDNLRGIVLMTAAMAGFALADMFIKGVSHAVPVGEVLLVLGVGGTAIFATLALLRGEAPFGRDFFSPLILLRNLGEMAGTFGFVTALALTPLAAASAIIQAMPLAITLGAALFLGEPVGWRRWTAIAVGFGGVVMVIRPGLEGFQPASLFAVLAVIGLSVRDLATRAAPGALSAMRLSVYGFATLIPSSLVLLALDGPPVRPEPLQAAALLAALLLDAAGYFALTLAMRAGDVATVTPFRYSRILFAIVIGFVVFAERPDIWTLLGALVIVVSGLYTLMRERFRRTPAPPLSPPPRER